MIKIFKLKISPTKIGIMETRHRLIDQEIRQFSQEIGGKIRQERKRAGLTLVETAQALGIAKQTLSDLETARKPVGLLITLMVCRQLGIALLPIPMGQLQRVQKYLTHLQSMSEKEDT